MSSEDEEPVDIGDEGDPGDYVETDPMGGAQALGVDSDSFAVLGQALAKRREDEQKKERPSKGEE